MLAILRTFKYLRVFRSFSPIVTMMISVIFDLQQFLFFYFILCGLLSMILDSLCLANLNIKNNNLFRDEFYG